MSAWATRVHIRALHQHYLIPLALTGNTAQDMETRIQDGLNGTYPLTQIYDRDAQDGDDPIAEGYELTRSYVSQEEDQTLQWTERVLVVRSFAHAGAMKRGLEQRLTTATAKLKALTPPRGRGKRQIEEEVGILNWLVCTKRTRKNRLTSQPLNVCCRHSPTSL